MFFSKTYILILTKKCKAHQGIFFCIPYFSKKEAQTSIKFTTVFDYYKINQKVTWKNSVKVVLCSTFKNDQKIKVLFLH